MKNHKNIIIKTFFLTLSVFTIVFFVFVILIDISRIEFRRYRITYTFPFPLLQRESEKWFEALSLSSPIFSPPNMQYTLWKNTNLVVEFIIPPTPQDLKKFEEALLSSFFEETWQGPFIREQPLLEKKRIRWILVLLSLAFALGVGFEYLRGKIYESKQ